MEVGEQGEGKRPPVKPAGHVYKVLQCVPPTASGGKRLGRPKRVVVSVWTDLSDEQLALLRGINDCKIRSNQLVEVDGEVVCRGTGVSTGDDGDVEMVAWDDNQIAANFAQSLVWDGYLRSVEAAGDVQGQLKRANDQVIELSQQLAAQANEHRKQMAAQAEEHGKQMAAKTAEHNKQLSEMLDEMLKFKVSLLKTPAPGGVDADKLAEIGLKIADALVNRKG